MAAANTDKFRKKKNLFSTTLNGGITSDATTLTCNSLTGVPTDTAVTITVDRVDANGTSTPTLREDITGVVSGSNLTNLVRGEGATTAQAHSNGAVVEITWETDTWNDAIDAILVGHTQAGLHDLNGGEMILDADADTSITADTDDQIDIKIANADDFKFTANTFAALSGSKITTNTIEETTAGSGVTIPFIGVGAPTELTISSGAITITGSYHKVDTEGDAATDDLTDILGGNIGQILILRSENSGRDPTIKDGGNLYLAGDFTFTSTTDHIVLIKYSASTWAELSRSDNG